jgi:hypothetical protein
MRNSSDLDILTHRQTGTPAVSSAPVRDSVITFSETPLVALPMLPGVVVVGTPRITRQKRNILERWFDAWTDRTEAEELEASTTTLNLLRKSGTASLELHPPSAWDAAQELRSWLGVTFDDLSAMTGIGESTMHSWRKLPVVPRPSKVAPLWRLFTLARALQARLGPEGATVWLRSGDPSPLRLLVEGRLSLVEEEARESVLRPAPVAENPFMSASMDERISAVMPRVSPRPAGSVRSARRPVRKGRPQPRD